MLLAQAGPMKAEGVLRKHVLPGDLLIFLCEPQLFFSERSNLTNWIISMNGMLVGLVMGRIKMARWMVLWLTKTCLKHVYSENFHRIKKSASILMFTRVALPTGYS